MITTSVDSSFAFSLIRVLSSFLANSLWVCLDVCWLARVCSPKSAERSRSPGSSSCSMIYSSTAQFWSTRKSMPSSTSFRWRAWPLRICRMRWSWRTAGWSRLAAKVSPCTRAVRPKRPSGFGTSRSARAIFWSRVRLLTNKIQKDFKIHLIDSLANPRFLSSNFAHSWP